MNSRSFLLTLAGACILAGGGYGMYVFGKHEGMRSSSAAEGAPGAQASGKRAAGADAGTGTGTGTGRKVLYWHDPMVPGQRFDKPGKSPFMDMDLVPVYADEGQAPGGVAVSPAVQQNLGMRLAEARMGSLGSILEAVGSVAFNERDLVVLQARSNGYVEKLFVRAPLDPVRKDQALLQLYVPDWVAAQEEYLAIKRMPASADTAGLLEAALQRMRLVGMTEAQVKQVSARAQVSPRLTVTAPADGVVSELSVREGMAVTQGAPLFRINGLRTVWVNAEVPESAAQQVRPGMAVSATSPALPDTAFNGKVEAVLPEVNAATRTLKARIELANPGAKLVPGMFASVRLVPAASREALLVPSEALIRTGTRSVVVTAPEPGRFAAVEVMTGAEANGQTEVIKGLSAGQKVVASGQFLIDSEASLRGALQRLGGSAPDAPKPSTPTPAITHRATGKVEQIAGDEVTISHGPIPALKWGPMTMGFVPPAGGLPKDIKVGDTVRFEIQEADDGTYRIVSIVRTGGVE